MTSGTDSAEPVPAVPATRPVGPVLLLASGAVGAAAVAAGESLRGAPSLAALVVLLGASPVLVGLACLTGRGREWALVALPVGALAAVAGVVLAERDDSLDLIRLDFPVTQVVTGAAVWLAPVGLVAAGLVLLLTGAAAGASSRAGYLVAGALGVLLTAVVSLAVLAHAFQSLSYSGGRVEPAPILTAAVLAVAAALLLVLAVRLDTLLPAAKVAPAGRSRRSVRVRGTALGVAGLLVLAVAGAVAWTQRQVDDRLRLGELFADPALAACVRSAVGDRDQVSARELAGVTALNCNGDTGRADRITRLDGLSQLPNLTSLDVSNNEVDDVAQLAAVPRLTRLKLTNNTLRDVGGLGALPGLTELGLSGNQVYDVTQLQALTAVRYLGLAGNDIDDVAGLAGLTALTELDLGDNQITDVAPLAALGQLDRLTLARNKIVDPAALQRLPNLTMLDLRGNKVSDAAGLSGCPKVDELWLGENPITDLRPLLAMKALQGVDLEGLPPDTKGIDMLRDKGVYVGGLA